MSKKAKKVNAMESFVAPSVLPVMYLDPLTKAEQEQRRSSKQRSRKLLAAPAAPPRLHTEFYRRDNESDPDFLARLTKEEAELIGKREQGSPKFTLLERILNWLKLEIAGTDSAYAQEVGFDGIQYWVSYLRNFAAAFDNANDRKHEWLRELREIDAECDQHRQGMESMDLKSAHHKVVRLKNQMGAADADFAKRIASLEEFMKEVKDHGTIGNHATRGDAGDDGNQNTSSAGTGKRMGLNQFLVLVLFVLYVHLF